ncbi:MAG: DUF1761 domain-containing protein [Saprospiraceae bacterium]
MAFNFIAVLVAALVPMLIGFLWYNPKLFGNAWMKASGMTEEKIKSGNMAVIFGVSFLLSFLLAIYMNVLAIHQNGIDGIFVVNGEMPAAGSEEAIFLADFHAKYDGLHRTFTHGVVHGILTSILFVLPIMGTNALFERKGWKYILINVGYWMVTISIMAGIVCSWV